MGPRESGTVVSSTFTPPAERRLTSRDSFLILHDMGLIRGTALLGYPELVRELGADPAPLLRYAGVPAEAIGDIDAFIGFRNTVVAIETAAKETGALDFGRRLAQKQGLDILGPLGVAARTASTVEAALRAIIDYMTTYSPAIAISMSTDPERRRTRVEYRILIDGLPDHRQTVELALGVSLNTYRILVGPTFAPLVVHLPHAPIAPRRDYTYYFGGRVKFEEPSAAFTIKRSDIERQIAGDSDVHKVVIGYLQAIAPAREGRFAPQVRELVRHLLATGVLDITLVASQFAVHPRTLQRKLAAESTTFDEVVDDVRRELARTYLRDTDMPLGQLAGVLGYSEQSVLSRASRRWFGRSPLDQRRLLRSGTPEQAVQDG